MLPPLLRWQQAACLLAVQKTTASLLYRSMVCCCETC
jgi:hypothetical protein